MVLESWKTWPFSRSMIKERMKETKDRNEKHHRRQFEGVQQFFFDSEMWYTLMEDNEVTPPAPITTNVKGKG